jgi:hypothetical protein
VISCCPLRWNAWSPENPAVKDNKLPDSTQGPRSRPGWRSIFPFPQTEHGLSLALGRQRSSAVPPPPPSGLWPSNAATQRQSDSVPPQTIRFNPIQVFFGKKEIQANGRPASPEKERTWPSLIQDDPLNVHQKIVKSLRDSGRNPITSVHHLANLITTCCVNVFDQHQIPEEFQFFEFFDRSIGIVVSRTTYQKLFHETDIKSCRMIIKRPALNNSR